MADVDVGWMWEEGRGRQTDRQTDVQEVSQRERAVGNTWAFQSISVVEIGHVGWIITNCAAFLLDTEYDALLGKGSEFSTPQTQVRNHIIHTWLVFEAELDAASTSDSKQTLAHIT